jgi:hypothetical protein
MKNYTFYPRADHTYNGAQIAKWIDEAVEECAKLCEKYQNCLGNELAKLIRKEIGEEYDPQRYD